MRVLVVCAHPNPKSFCHALVGRFVDGAREAGHEVEILDLHAVRFDPVFKTNDYLQFVDEERLPDVEIVRAQLVAGSGGPLRRFIAARWLKNKPLDYLLALIARQRPKDVTWHQRKVADAQALVFVAPVFWMGFPAILKGWIERVFTYGFAYKLDDAGWQGDFNGRIPLLKHKRALVISPTFFAQAHYAQGWQAAMTKVGDEWTFSNTGIENVAHEFFYAANAADAPTRAAYLQRAFTLGKTF